MTFDNRAADRQAHSEPIGLGCIKGLEDIVQMARVESRSRILHAHAEFVALDLSRADKKHALSRVHLAHRLDGVDDQVEYHLLQLYPVALNRRQSIDQLQRDIDTMLVRFSAHERDQLANRRVDIQAVPALGLLLVE